MSPRPDWPLVDPKDDGIRPPSAPITCFYCQRVVGQPHGAECVIVTKRVEMEVRVGWPVPKTLVDADGDAVDVHGLWKKRAGLWQFTEPHFWDEPRSVSHKNESSWCANNFLDVLTSGSADVTLDEPIKTQLLALYEAMDKTHCACGLLDFMFERVVDDTPRRKVRP